MPADGPWAVGDHQQRWNGYLDPSTGILRNLVGAQTWDELHQRENAYVEYRALELRARPVPQTFDLDHLRALHGHLFQDVYAWAGEIRTVDMGKRAAPGVAGPGFLPHGQVPDVMEHVRDVLRDVKWLRTSSLSTAKQTLPILYNIVNTAHPFRGGNGRTQRQFFNDLATGAGFKIDWTSIPKAVNDRASEMARGGDELLMKAMFDVIVSETPERAARSAGLAGFTRPGEGPTPSVSEQGPARQRGLLPRPRRGSKPLGQPGHRRSSRGLPVVLPIPS